MGFVRILIFVAAFHFCSPISIWLLLGLVVLLSHLLNTGWAEFPVEQTKAFKQNVFCQQHPHICRVTSVTLHCRGSCPPPLLGEVVVGRRQNGLAISFKVLICNLSQLECQTLPHLALSQALSACWWWSHAFLLPCLTEYVNASISWTLSFSFISKRFHRIKGKMLACSLGSREVMFVSNLYLWEK